MTLALAGACGVVTLLGVREILYVNLTGVESYPVGNVVWWERYFLHRSVLIEIFDLLWDPEDVFAVWPSPINLFVGLSLEVVVQGALLITTAYLTLVQVRAWRSRRAT